MTTVEDLVQAAQQGQLRAYDSLVERFQDMAVGYAYAQLGDFHLAQDTAQEAFIGAYGKLAQLREAPAFTSWFRQILHRQCLMARRRPSLDATPLDSVPQLAAQEPRPDRLAEERDMRQVLHQAIADLPDRQAEALTLFYMGEYSHREVAAFLGTSTDTVKNRLRAGRQKLKENLFAMAKNTLHNNAPSNDQSFATVVSLCNAAQAGDLARVQELLQANPGLATRPISQNDQLAIQFAARQGHRAIVALLLDKGANPLTGVYPNRQATSALALARDRGHSEIVALIEDFLAQHPAKTTHNGRWTPLIEAVQANDVAAARALLEADSTLANPQSDPATARALAEGDPALLEYATRPLRQAAETGALDMARLLLDFGADPDAAFPMDHGDEGVYNNAGEPLWKAAKAGHYDLCQLLLECGADPNAYVFASGPAAERAMENGFDDILDLIYCYGGHSFATAAAMCGRVAVAAETLHLKPEMAAEILGAAAMGGRIGLVKLCLRHDLAEANWFGLMGAPIRGPFYQARLRYTDDPGQELTDKVEILRLMIEDGADVNATGQDQATILHRIIGETSKWADAEKVPFIKLLLEAGANIDAREESLQATPLALAARYGHLEVAQLLLEQGAQSGLPDDEQWATPLAQAEKGSHAALVELLQQAASAQ
ncbi:MAG: sigma-70 family RNA polymerase sigma factor [Candidatus Latescibacteria bacterium]|nr:sigma-70 family RNA polymerase sigma factor [Candidatus Latescibacterota bacterium]